MSIIDSKVMNFVENVRNYLFKYFIFKGDGTHNEDNERMLVPRWSSKTDSSKS